MKIIVASFNPVKLNAVRDAFTECFPGQDLTVEAVAVESGVAEQPMSDEETFRGARQRVEAARQAIQQADYWVGLEGGLELLRGQMLASAWMVVMNAAGEIGQARTPTLPLPPGIQALVESGLELGDANDQVFSTVNSKQGGGAFGLLTEGLLTRQSVYSQTLVLALTPLRHALWKV